MCKPTSLYGIIHPGMSWTPESDLNHGQSSNDSAQHRKEQPERRLSDLEDERLYDDLGHYCTRCFRALYPGLSDEEIETEVNRALNDEGIRNFMIGTQRVDHELRKTRPTHVAWFERPDILA